MATKLVICGKAGSGKTYLKDHLAAKGEFTPSVPVTTQPQREGEIDGRDYYFVTDDEFQEMNKEQAFIEWQELYGTLIREWEHCNLFILTPAGISSVMSSTDLRIKGAGIYVIYLDIDEETRFKRLKLRNESDAVIERRIKADQSDFGCMETLEGTMFNLKITDPKFDPMEIARTLLG